MDGPDDWITAPVSSPQSVAPVAAAPAVIAPPDASAAVVPDQSGGDDSVDRPLTIRPAAPSAAAASVDDWVTPTPDPTSSGSGILSNSPDDGWLSGAAKGTATGVIRGASSVLNPAAGPANIADLLVATADSHFSGQSVADTLADIKAQRAAEQAPLTSSDPGLLGSIENGAHWLAGATDPRNLLPGADWLSNKVEGLTGAYEPTTSLGRAAQGGVEAVAGSVGPGVGSKVGTMANVLGSAAKMAPVNFASGAASQAVTDATGNPLYGMGAGIAAPSLLHSAARVGQKVPGPVGSYFQGVNDARIGRQLYGLAENPAAVQSVINPTDLSSNPSSIAVPGFKPTTGQLTGDLKLLDAENELKLPDNTAFNARAGQQNAAAQGALASISAGGDELRPSTVLQQQLDTLDQATRQAQSRITAGAQQLAAGLGPGETADSLGATIRSKVDAVKQQEAQMRSDLYDAVDPDGTLATTAAPIKTAAAGIMRSIDPYAEPLSDDEKRLFGLAQQMPAVMPYKSLVAFDRNLNSALPNATRGSKARLQQLKAAAMATLDGTADGLGQNEAKQVAAGTRDPADTVVHRLQQAAPLAAGAPPTGSSVFTPSGRKIGVRYGVMEAGDLTASHSPDMTPNPDYPANLQPRDRSRAASGAQVADIASNLQPERLGASASAAEGAPIVGPDGLVESGNGRVLAIQRAHAAGGPQSRAYRDFLASHGFDASGMKAPVLVRQRITDLSPDERLRFAQEANASPVLASSATERAATDAGRLPDTVLAQFQGGDVGSTANRPFVRGFLNSVAEKGEAGQFAAPDGSLSLDGARRVQNALVHAGYGDHKLVSALAETGDPDVAAFGGVMSDQAGRMAQLRRGIAAGDIHPDADISRPVIEAGRVVQRARAGNMRLADAVAQQDAFNPISNEAHAVLRAAYGPDLTARLSRSRTGAYLSDAMNEATQQTAAGRLFGEPLTAAQILEGAQSRAARSAEAPDALAYGTGDSRASVGAPGQGGERPGAGASGPGSPGPGAGSSVVDRAPLAENMDPAAAGRLRAAKDAHIQLQRFTEGPVSKAIDRGDFGRFTQDVSTVPAMAIVKGDTGYSTAKAFLRDSNNDPAVLEAMTDRALAPLRTSLTSEGTVNPTKYAAWKRDYGPALRALEEADPGFSSRYDNAAQATNLMTRAGALREQALKSYQDKTTAKFLGATDASEVQDLVGKIIQDKSSGVTRMKALVGKLNGDPDAMEGLRRAGAGYLAQHFSNASNEAATANRTLSTKLPKEVADKRAVLSTLFSEPEVNRINAVAHVLDLKQRSVDALKNKGTSTTSRDTIRALNKIGDKAGHGHGTTTLLALAGDRAVESLWDEGLKALPAAALGGAGLGAVWALNRIRSGNARADRAAIADALMNPERFGHYTANVSPDQAERRGAALSAMIRRQLITMPAMQHTMARKGAEPDADGVQGYARGGAALQSRSAAGAVDQGRADRAADELVRMAGRISASARASSAVQAAMVSAGAG